MNQTANQMSSVNQPLPVTYTVYKPTRSGNGSAMSFSFNRSKEAIFVEASHQCGERKFDWDNKIIMKWGLSDIGCILSSLTGKKAEASLFHQTENANSGCKLSFREPDADKPERMPFLLSISRQNSDTKEVKKVAITLSDSEASILETALRTAIGRILRW